MYIVAQPYTHSFNQINHQLARMCGGGDGGDGGDNTMKNRKTEQNKMRKMLTENIKRNKCDFELFALCVVF